MIHFKASGITNRHIRSFADMKDAKFPEGQGATRRYSNYTTLRLNCLRTHRFRHCYSLFFFNKSCYILNKCCCLGVKVFLATPFTYLCFHILHHNAIYLNIDSLLYHISFTTITCFHFLCLKLSFHSFPDGIYKVIIIKSLSCGAQTTCIGVTSTHVNSKELCPRGSSG